MHIRKLRKSVIEQRIYIKQTSLTQHQHFKQTKNKNKKTSKKEEKKKMLKKQKKSTKKI